MIGRMQYRHTAKVTLRVMITEFSYTRTLIRITRNINQISPRNVLIVFVILTFGIKTLKSCFVSKLMFPLPKNFHQIATTFEKEVESRDFPLFTSNYYNAHWFSIVCFVLESYIQLTIVYSCCDISIDLLISSKRL